MKFDYQSFPTKVSFGSPLLEALEKYTPQGRKSRVFLIAGKRQQGLAAWVQAHPDLELVYHFDQIAQHVPKTLVTEALALVDFATTDLLLAVGGGSAIGLAKALALETKKLIWAAPTTYSGSEMTNIYGISTEGKKTVGRDEVVLPQLIIYDPALTQSLPATIALTSATNALAHLVEGLYAQPNNPLSYQQALMGMQHIQLGYRSFAKGETQEANEQWLMGAYLGGKTLCELPMALHHKAAHVLGGNFGLDHARTHTALLPYILDYQWDYLPELVRQDFNAVWPETRAAQGLWQQLQSLGLALSLQSLGLTAEALPEAAAQISALAFVNPAPTDHKAIYQLLTRAYEGYLS